MTMEQSGSGSRTFDFRQDAEGYARRARGVRIGFLVTAGLFVVLAVYYFEWVFPADSIGVGIPAVPVVLVWAAIFVAKPDPQLSEVTIDSDGLHIRYSSGSSEDLAWDPARFSLTFEDPRGLGGPEHRGPNVISLNTPKGPGGWVPEALVAAVVEAARAHAIPVATSVEGQFGYKSYHRSKVTRVGTSEQVNRSSK